MVDCHDFLAGRNAPEPDSEGVPEPGNCRLPIGRKETGVRSQHKTLFILSPDSCLLTPFFQSSSFTSFRTNLQSAILRASGSFPDGLLGAFGGDIARDFERRVDLGLVVVNVARLSDSQVIAHGARAQPFARPQLVFELHGRHALDPPDDHGPAQFGMDRGADLGAGDLLQAGAQAIGQRAHPLADAFRSDTEVEVERGIEAGLERRVAGAVLHEAIHALLMIVPLGTAQRSPEEVLLLARDVKNAVAGGRQQPLVGTGEVGVATHVVEIDLDLPHRLGAIHNGEAAVLVGQRGKARTRVRGVIACRKRSTNWSGSLAGMGIFTCFHTAPSRLARSCQPQTPPGCSWSVVMISSPAFRSIPWATKFMPKVAFWVRAISSAEALTSFPTFSRKGVSGE